MRKLLSAVGLSILILAFGVVDARASCMRRVHTLHGQTVDGYMYVNSGKTCTISFHSRGPTERTEVIERPSHGTVTPGSIGRLTYRSQKGFVGSDMFVYRRSGLDMTNNPSIRTVRVHVTVQ